MMNAASYSDCWTRVETDQGQVIATLSSWYICKAGTCRQVLVEEQWKFVQCLRVFASKEWQRKLEDPLAKHQAWYCTCGKKYRANYGQVVRMQYILNNNLVSCYMLADVPSWDVEDVRAMYYESDLAQGCQTPMELCERVPYLRPEDDAIFEADPLEPSTQRLRDDVLSELPHFSWWEIFGMIMIPPPKGVKKP